MASGPFDLTGKIALVTGAYRGLGFAIAAGPRARRRDRRPQRPQAGARRARRTNAHRRRTERDDPRVRRHRRRGGAQRDRRDRGAARRLDILVNNAGIQRRSPLVEFTKDDWDDVIATNLTAPFLVSQAVLPGMIARRSGKIIHIASLMSELARPTVVPYTAAKGGVRQLTRGMAVELAPHNIQVNAIAPGYFATEMNRALIDNQEFNAWVCKRTPAGRWGQPDEIAGLAVFLASSAADYMTGQMLVMDGGHERRPVTSARSRGPSPARTCCERRPRSDPRGSSNFPIVPLSHRCCAAPCRGRATTRPPRVGSCL